MLFLKVCLFTICPWGFKTSKASTKSSHDSAILKQFIKISMTIRTPHHRLTYPPTQRLWLQWFWLYSVGGNSSLLQCDGSDVAQLCCTDDCTCTVSCCNCPILWRTVSLLFLLALASVWVCESASPNFGWDSSAAPPELQGSGTSAMQKSIYSHGVTGKEREGERETERHSQTKRHKDEGGRRGEGKRETMNEENDSWTENELETDTGPTQCSFVSYVKC